MVRNSSGVTCCMRMRLEWNVKVCVGRTASRARSMLGNLRLHGRVGARDDKPYAVIRGLSSFRSQASMLSVVRQRMSCEEAPT